MISFPSIENRKAKIANGFTLIELLTVITVIAVLAAFTIPVLAGIKRQAYIHKAQAEMTQLETAIQSYHDALGFYPPDNAKTANYLPNALTNQLYYELSGTTNSYNRDFTTLAGDSTLPETAVNSVFGRGGFVNCSKPGAGEDTPMGRDFLPELKQGQTGTISVGSDKVTLLTTAAGGPDTTYTPLGPSYQGLNPWRYKSSGTLTNNPGSYELWVQLRISGKKYLICNWNSQVQINSPLP